jgi:anaerobic selenocysteine-containing dehydrogenase
VSVAKQSTTTVKRSSRANAARIGVAEGDRVRLRNATGAIELVAHIDDSLLVGTAVAYKGRWPSLETDKTNVNFVHTPRKTDMGESTSVHATEVIIEAIG